jgi:hypothetical protein
MRRRRERHQGQGDDRQGGNAGNQTPAYQPDGLARASRPAYEQYEIYEEYEATAPPQQPARQRSTVVIPAMTLPSVPAMPATRVSREPRRPTPGWRRTGDPDLSRDTYDADEDDSWLTGNTRAAPPAPRRPVRAQLAPAPTPLEEERVPSGTWHDTPTGAWDATRGWEGAPGAAESAYAPYDSRVATRTTVAPRPQNPHHRLTQAERIAPSVLRVRQPGRIRRLTQRVAGTILIPTTRSLLPRPARVVLGRLGGALAAITRRPTLASAVVLSALLIGFLLDVTGAAQQAGLFSANAWQAIAGALPSTNAIVSGQMSAPPNYDIQHYMDKYGFFRPGPATAIAADEAARLTQMLPAATRAAAAYDQRYNKSIEPQMLLYWTHSEGIRARINYSDCANENTPGGTSYFTYIANCDHASFWQLGYGNQFGVIYVLRNAFTDLYGDPNDTQLVAKVGQGVLDFDKQAGTTPACGGYSCTFPAKTIDDILSGVNLRTGVVAEGNWWASVLSRDPAINCYMIAHALTYFSHEATRNWVGCYYATPCWQRNSDRLGDILAAWPNLIKAAGIQS